MGIQPVKVVPRHRAAADEILRFVRDAGLKQGDRLPGERTLATRLGVSYMTLREATAHLSREGVLRREHGRGTFVADSAAGGDKTRTIAAVLPWGKVASIGLHLLEGIEASARENGKHLTIFNTANRSEIFPDMLEEAFAAGVRGMIVWPSESTETSVLDVLARLTGRDVAIVCVDRYWVEFPTDRALTNESDTGVAVVGHLKQQGYRSIWYAGDADMYATTAARDRLAGINRAAGQFGVRLACSEPMASPEHLRAFVAEALSASDGPPAIVCQNSITTVDVNNLLAKLAATPPGDVGLVGYDDSNPILAHLPVPVTMVRQDFEGIGAGAVELLMERLDGRADGPPRSIEVPARLIVRQSTTVEPGSGPGKEWNTGVELPAEPAEGP